ncbi:MAG: GtrA family protein [Ruminococcus sp.]|nr:GtrA family protein [Ruminococcus sp.]
MEKIKALLKKYKEIIMYIIFGVLTTLVNWVVYWVTEPLLSSAMHGNTVIWTVFGKEITMSILAIFLANFIAWVAGVIFAFVTNKIWVFESKSWRFGLVMKELWLFVLARLITGVLEWFGVPLLVAMGLNQPLFGAEGFVAKLIVSVIVVILNYVFSKLIIFRKKDKKKDDLEKAAEELNEAE